ncbi:DUF1351 domain-containing protein [uncultured Allobaculum sp.]|uniref:DUF1351 domain-containing protein n=1 Tax=uncultured Allobaculum sp. TaxID=1187017 RepID=UPI00258C7A82|nr:DUF1351 domain-containing protein [uncultured Allobaculum sp.]
MSTFALVPSMKDGVLATNAAELAAAVRTELENYNYVVTSENYKDAKEDRAKLNSIVTQLSESRKRIENEVFKTWKQDKSQIMSIEKDIKDASAALGEGIKAIDDKAKAHKAEMLEAQWNEMGGVLYPFAAVLSAHKSWMNKTAKKADVEAEMASEISVLKANESVLTAQITDLPEEHQCMVMERFYRTMNLPGALQEVERIQQALARVEEEKRRAAERQAQVEARMIEPKPTANPVPDTIPAREVPAAPVTEHSNRTYRRAFLIDASKEQLMALAEAMKSIGIKILDIRGKNESLPERFEF